MYDEECFNNLNSNTLCNTFTPKIKGIQRITYLMLPSFSYFKDFIMVLLSQYEETVEGFLFIMKDGNFDCGIYLITAIE